MTDDRLPLAELMAKTGDGDFLRTIAESVLQIIMEADVDGLVGAGRHERPASARPGAMATVTAASIPGSARST
jgi:transposase-like protein